MYGDDILAIHQCSKDSVKSNAVMSAFIEMKKMNLSEKKCSKIHVGKQSKICPELKVHDSVMKVSEKRSI